MKTEDLRTWHDLVIEHGMVALLVFSPLAFGSVHIWASSLLQIGSFIIFFAWLCKASRERSIAILGWHLIVPAAVFALLVIVQLLPLPPDFVKAITPAASAIYETTGETDAGRWLPISIHPQATLQELLNFLAYLSAFIVVMNHWKSKEQILRLVRVMIAMGCFLVIIAVLQKAFWNGRLYWFYPIDPALQSRLSYIWGPYVNRNHFAGYLEIVIPIALGYLVYTASRKRGGSEGTLVSQAVTLTGSRHLPKITVLFLAVALMSGALFATLSRGAILGFLASITLFYLLARSRRSLRRRIMLVLFIAVVLGIVGLFAAWDRIEERFMEISDEDRIVRTQVWSDLLGVVKDYPVLGTGLGTFEKAFTKYQSRYSTVLFEHAENDYLEILTDTGILGAGIAVSTGVVFFWSAVRRWSRRRISFATSLGLGGIASCTAIAVHGLTDFNLRVPANALLLFVAAALTVAILFRGRERDGMFDSCLENDAAEDYQD